MSATSTIEKKKLTWKDVARSLAKPKVAVMVGLGFSSGRPFMLVGNTLGFWLREGGITLTTIGYLSWVGLAYSSKFLWAPLIDKVRVPVLGKIMGLRRGWLLFSQVLVMLWYWIVQLRLLGFLGLLLRKFIFL